MSAPSELWDGRWVVCRTPMGAGSTDIEPLDPAMSEAIVGLSHLPTGAQPPVAALISGLDRPIDAQLTVPLPTGGHALLAVRGDPAHVEVIVSGAGPPSPPDPADPLVAVLPDGRRAPLAGVAACVVDPDGTTAAVTPALAELVGSSARRIRLFGIESVVAEADRGRVLTVVRRGAEAVDGVCVVSQDGGPQRWVTVTGLDLAPDPGSRADDAPTDNGRLILLTEMHPRFATLARTAHRSTAAFTQATPGRARLDSKGDVMAANPAMGRLVDQSTDELTGRALTSLIDLSHRGTLSLLLTSLLAGDLSGFELELRLVSAASAEPPVEVAGTVPDPGPAAEATVIGLTDGAGAGLVTPASASPTRPDLALIADPTGDAVQQGPRWVRVQVDPVAMGDGTIEVDVELRDVAGRRRAESEDRDTIDALRSAFIHAPTPMAVIDLDGRIREANSELRSLLDLGEVDSQAVGLADLAPEDDWRSIDGALAEITLGRRARVECRLRRRDGSDGVVELAVSAVTSPDHASPFAIAQVNDITRQRNTEEKLLHQTLHDPLTGLGNRLLLRERLERAVAARNSVAFALMFIDLDHFKWTNDTHGHDAGDALLVEIARRLRASVRGSDTVARLGGDEFVIMAAGVSEEGVARALAEKVRRAIAMPFALADHLLTVTASVGVVLPGVEHDTADALLRDADLAMYRAKSTGRDRHEVTVGAADVAPTPVAHALRLALDTDSLRLHHQPIFDLRTGRAVGTEALLRVIDPVAGTRPPGRLLQGITDAELLAELAGWVLDQAVEQMTRWDDEGVGPLGAWVNLSGAELETDALLERVSRTLDRTGVDAAQLHLEVPEPALLLASASGVDRLRTLATLGLRIGIDDFGTGSTSLAHLRSLPLHFLKIDPSIGRRLAEPGGGAVVEAVVAVGRALGLEVIAEEIEERVQMEVLAQVGCTHAQGNLFAAPAPAAELWHLDATLGDDRRP